MLELIKNYTYDEFLRLLSCPTREVYLWVIMLLADFFTEHREEVIEVSIYDYDEEGVIRVNREEGYEDGIAQGKDIMLISLIIPKVKKEKSLDRISEELELEPDDIRHIYEAVVAAAPEYDADIIKESIKHG